jgi:twitching motility protein PilU
MTVSGKQPIEVILEMLRVMVDRKASDLFISVGFPPAMKVDGQVTPIAGHVFNEIETKALPVR